MTIKFKGDPVAVAIGKRSVVELPPRVFRARLTGFFFDTDRCFLLPRAMHGIRRLKGFHDEHPGHSVLVTGHTDTVGADDHNVLLSVDRARSVSAFLRDAVDEWLVCYTGTGHSHPWGTREDQYMLATLPQSQPPYYTGPATGTADGATREAIRRFQADEGLTVDGIAGPHTRRALIARYMALEGTSLLAGTPISTHGCGPFHPAVNTGPNVEKAENRRSEVFFFEGPVLPPPRTPCASPGCPEYPIWVSQLVHSFDIDLPEEDDDDPLAFSIHAPPANAVALQIRDGARNVIRTLGPADGERNGDQVRFTFAPATLPNPMQLCVLRDHQEERFGGGFDPTALRDALEDGDLEAAIRIFDGDAPASGGKAGDDGPPGGSKVDSAALAATPTAAAGPSTGSDLKLRIHYDNELHPHRFVKARTITLTDPSGAVIPGKTSVVVVDKTLEHAVTFDVPATATGFVLTVRIDDPDPGIPPPAPILLITETAAISRLAPGPPVALFAAPMNRRLRFVAASYSTKTASTFIDLHLDLTFLDVTAHAKALPNNNRFRAFLATNPLCDYVVLEFTGNATTTHVNTWIVAIPPSYDRDKRTDSNVFLFFRNELMTRISANKEVPGFYKNADDCHYGAVAAFFQAPAKVGTYLPTGTTFEEYPIGGWDQQLADSKKQVMAFFPIPLLAGFLGLDDPANASRVFQHALVALFAGKHIGRTTDVYPTVKRFAVGGWSSGTNRLYDNWTKLNTGASIVDELYFFDGLTNALPNLAAWFKAKPDRCMRLLGTAYTEDGSVATIKAIQPPSPDATAIPGDLSYWYTNPDFKRAFTPRASSSRPLEKFKSSGTPPSSPHIDVSDDTAVFLDAIGPAPPTPPTYGNAFVTLSWTDPKGKVSKHRFEHLSETELASLVRYFARGGSTTPLATQAEFDQLVSDISNTGVASESERAHKLRHPWSMAGGVWDTTGTVFTGYLQLCLSLGKF